MNTENMIFITIKNFKQIFFILHNMDIHNQDGFSDKLNETLGFQHPKDRIN